MKCPVCGNELEIVKNLRRRVGLIFDLAHCAQCDNRFHVFTNPGSEDDPLLKILPREDGYDDEGYDKEGYDRDGFDRDGIDRSGRDAEDYEH